MKPALGRGQISHQSSDLLRPLPKRPSGHRVAHHLDMISGHAVAVGPGWTLLTVIPRGARSIAAPRTSEAIAPFVIE